MPSPRRLWPMGGDTAFVPGHGPMSTFAHERATNPYVGGPGAGLGLTRLLPRSFSL